MGGVALRRCTACQGKGEVYADPRGDENGRGLKVIECPVCGGRGEEEIDIDTI